MLDAEMAAGRRMPDGVALLAVAIDGQRKGLLADLALFPTFAATAWYHGMVDRQGKSVDQFYQDALAFARNEYVTALIREAHMSQDERMDAAQAISRFLGLSPADLVEHGLAIDEDRFMKGLLGTKGLRTGRLDSRATRAIAQSNLHPPFDDPAMKLGSAGSEGIEAYLRDGLGYALTGPYRSLNLGINFKWNWGEGATFYTAEYIPYLMAALKKDPGLKIFTSGGYYDITTPAYGSQLAMDLAHVPLANRSAHFYAAGHSVFEDETQLARLSADLRAWILKLGR
jgi:carboxypeptidase C (cathepsin A)